MTARIFGIAGSSNSAEDFRLSAGGIFVPASAINDRTGVTSVPGLTGTGALTATVGAFSCLIDGTSNALQGSYWVTLDAAASITITSGNTQPRVDLISMQILDNAYDASGFQKAQLVVTAGTPAGSPVAPAAPANSISLWTLPVPALATSVTFGTATAVFPYTSAIGGIVPVRNSTDKPAAINGVQYRHRLDITPGGAASNLEFTTDGTTYNPSYPAPVMQKIGQVTLGSALNNMTIAVPAGFSSVMGTWSARTTAAGPDVWLNMQFNGDTGGTYGFNFVEAHAGTPTGSWYASNSFTSIVAGQVVAASETAGYFSTGTFTISNYASTSQYKSVVGSAHKPSDNGAGAQFTGTYGGSWTNTAAINSIRLDPGSNFVAGSTFTLYGLL